MALKLHGIQNLYCEQGIHCNLGGRNPFMLDQNEFNFLSHSSKNIYSEEANDLEMPACIIMYD